jgi:O-antigen/teichoic acid export membrane protein
MSERRRSAVLGMVFGYASLMISLARNVLFVPIYLQKIPLAEYGAWLATGGALALILINDYGLAGVVTQRISARYGAGDFAALGRLTGSALAIGAFASIMLSVISLAFVPFLPGLSTLGAQEAHTVVACFVAAIAANALGIIGATATSVIRSLQKVVLSGSIMLFAETVNIIVILVGLYAGVGLYAIAAGMLARSVIIMVASLAGVWLVCTRNIGAKIEIHAVEIRDLVGEASHFFLSAIAMKLQAQANVFFVGSILGPTSAAIYSLTVRAHETVAMVISLINGSLVPSVTHLLGSGNLARFRDVLLRLFISVTALTALAMTMTVVLNSAFLRLWVGAYAFGGQPVSILMAAALFVSSVGYIAYDALLAQGKFRLVSRVYFFTSLLQLLLLMSLLHWGLWLAPTATMLTTGVWGYVFWRSVGVDIGLTLSEARGLIGELMRLVAVSTAGVAGFLSFYPNANTWTGLVIEGLVSGACLSIGYLAFSHKLRGILLEEIGSTLRVFRTT